MSNKLEYVRKRQKVLREAIAYHKDFDSWEESCVPSYCHPNPIAAGISWMRLFAAQRLAHSKGTQPKRVLDFGSSIGELGHLLPPVAQYDFIEGDDLPANFLITQLPKAKRTTLESAPNGAYDQVFAIDSLEHNTNYEELLELLIAKLAPGGIFILSGPTENWIYKAGRMIAGFKGHYHETNIHAIEAAVSTRLEQRGLISILPVATLFRVTSWQKITS